jgi:DNA primase
MAFFDYKKIDVEDFLNELGISNISKKGNQFWFSCPLEGHIGMDKTPSASMEIGTTRMHCFGCGFSGNAVSFLAKIEGVSPLKSRKWLRERFNMSAYVEKNEKFGDILKKKLERAETARQKTNKVHSHSIILDPIELEKRSISWYDVWDAWQGKIDYAYPLAYMLDRGFHPETLNEWAIGWDMISQRICIPIKDDLGNLVGFKGRSVDSLPKYLVLGGDEYGFETYNVSKVLFGLDKAKEYIDKEMIVVEGELNAIAMHQSGYKNTVGISGRTLSNEQENLIKKYCQKVTFIFDEFRDTMNAAKRLQNSIPVRVVPDHDKDPADMTKDELSKLLTLSRTSIMV